MGIVVPSINIGETDGNVSSVDVGRRPLVIVGPATGGTGVVGQPQSFTQSGDLIKVHAEGSLSDAGIDNVSIDGNSVIALRATASTAGTNGTVTSTGAGTSAVTLTGTPNSDYEPVLLITTAGTQGVAGIEYQTSLDGGRTMSAVSALGTGTSISMAGTGLSWALGAGTVLAGQKHAAVSTGPTCSSSDITTALAALTASSLDFEVVAISCPMTAAIYAAVATWIDQMRTMGRRYSWIGFCRTPLVSENEATYLSAMSTIFSSLNNAHCIGIVYGSVFSTHAVNGRQYRRPGFKYAGRITSVLPHIDVADEGLGSISGYQLTDASGTYVHHNELTTPGATAARFVTLKSGSTGSGVYITTPCTHAALGSDFKYAQHRRIMNAAQTASRLFFARRLSKGYSVNKVGRIKEDDAKQMERGADAYTGAAVEGMVSGVKHAIARDGNILSTEKLSLQLMVTTLAYIKLVEIDSHFVNPSLASF